MYEVCANCLINQILRQDQFPDSLLVEGLKPVDAGALAEFEREMAEEAIPEMMREVEKRRMLAAESRHRQLETPTTDTPEPTKE